MDYESDMYCLWSLCIISEKLGKRPFDPKTYPYDVFLSEDEMVWGDPSFPPPYKPAPDEPCGACTKPQKACESCSTFFNILSGREKNAEVRQERIEKLSLVVKKDLTVISDAIKIPHLGYFLAERFAWSRDDTTFGSILKYPLESKTVAELMALVKLKPELLDAFEPEFNRSWEEIAHKMCVTKQTVYNYAKKLGVLKYFSKKNNFCIPRKSWDMVREAIKAIKT